MPATHSTAPARADKPSKPYPDFPLTAHPAGYWCKKIRGKLYYFGRWDDPEGALQAYLDQKEALHAGRTPREASKGLCVKDVANAFLNAKQARVDTGELAQRTWDEYKATCALVVKQFGKGRLVDDLGPEDFAALRAKMARRWGPVRLGNEVQRVRSVFKYALDSGKLTRPVCFGPDFAR